MQNGSHFPNQPPASLSPLLELTFWGSALGLGWELGVGKGLQGPAGMVGAPMIGLHGSGAEVGPPLGEDIVTKAAASVSAL